MPKVRIREKEIIGKIVYYGPGLGGKTTNMEYLHQKAHPKFRGDLVSLATETDRTLFFDFMPMMFKKVGGYNLRLHLFTVPGQVFYEESRKVILKDADGVVFVADSHPARQAANEESMTDLQRNLEIYDMDIRKIPLVVQYNKRDLDVTMDIDDMRIDLNYLKVPDFEAVAVNGTGVSETFREVTKLTMTSIQDELV